MESTPNSPVPMWVYANPCQHVIVPPPRKFEVNNSCYQSIEDFFFYYENYAAYRYGFNKYVWLQILPEFLEGFVKEVVLEQGLGVNVEYETVKAKVVVLTTQRGDVEQWQRSFLSAPRDASEPISVFVSRLESQVASFPLMPGAMRRGLVRERLLRLLPADVTEYLRANLGSFEEVSSLELAELVRLYETSVGAQPERVEPPPPQETVGGVLSKNSEGVTPHPTRNLQDTSRVEKSVPPSVKIDPSRAGSVNNKSLGRKLPSQPCGDVTTNSRELTPPRNLSESRRSGRRPRCWVCRSRWHLKENCPARHRRRLASKSIATGANAIPIQAVAGVCSAPAQQMRSDSVGGDSLRHMFWDAATECNRSLTPLPVSGFSASGEALVAPETSTPLRGVTMNWEHSGSQAFSEQESVSCDSSACADKLEVMPTEIRALDWSYMSDDGFTFPEFKDYLTLSPLEGIC